jgi:hypothetical protein
LGQAPITVTALGSRSPTALHTLQVRTLRMGNLAKVTQEHRESRFRLCCLAQSPKQ